MEEKQIEEIKEVVKEFFEKTTIVSDIEISVVFSNINDGRGEREVIDLDVKINEPQILIGQQGQTLIEIQRLLRMILTKKLANNLYVNLDINGYKKKKIEYLQFSANDYADQVVAEKKEKALPPMSSYERRIVHSELSLRQDVIAESQGVDPERYILIKPK